MTNFAFLPDRFRAIGEAKLHGGGPQPPFKSPYPPPDSKDSPPPPHAHQP